MKERYTLKPLSEFPQISKESKIGMESAYRRGYTQGYWSALNDLQDGHSFQECIEHYEKLFKEWRTTTHNGEIDPPPELGRLQSEVEH